MTVIGEKDHTGKYKLFILLECFIWGVGNPVTRYIYLSMTPFCYMAVRFAIATLFFVLVFHKHIMKDLEWEKLKGCAVVGVFMGGAYIFGNLAIEQAMVTIAGFLMGTSVVFTSIFSVIFLKVKLGKRFLAILLTVIVGMYMLCCGGTGEFAFGLGEVYGLLSAACLGVTLLLSAKYIKDVTPYTLSAVQCGVTALLCLLFALIMEDFSCMSGALPVSWAALAYVTLGCTVAAFMLQNVSLRHLSPIFVSLAFSMEPIFTAIASFFMLGEKITAVGIIGSVLIMAGIIAASVINESK